ncbi:MAG: Gx transporter family protein [Duodenibacillus sp.]|nr:Gx transporter family protein [Duodenibacillus sp.]
MNKRVFSVKRLVLDGVLTAIALTIFVLELQIPDLIPIPGVKAGLANIVTVVAVFCLPMLDTFMILLSRILLGALVTGRIMACAYSLAGGACCLAVMLLLSRVLTKKQIFICSALGAVAHNLGQILMAYIITSTSAVFYYLPFLMASGILAGTFTGLAAQLAVNRLGSRFEDLR